MTPPRPVRRPPRKADANEPNFIFGQHLVRLILFLIAVFIITVWVNHHLSKSEWFVTGMGLFTVVFGLVSLLFDYSNEEDSKTSKKIIQSVLLFFTRTPVLFMLYAVIFIIGNMVSTVVVYGDGLGEQHQIILEGDSASGRMVSEAHPQTYLCMTEPFGKRYRVSVDGYLPESFVLYPWVGRSIHIAEEMTPVPTAYFRWGRHPDKMKYFVVESKEYGIDTFKVESGCGAIALGRKRNLPDHVFRDWPLALQALPDIQRENMPVVLQAWEKPFVNHNCTFFPGQRVRVSVLSPAPKLLATFEAEITADSFQDYLIK